MACVECGGVYRWCCSFPCGDLHIVRSSVPNTVKENWSKTVQFCTLLRQAEPFSNDKQAVTLVSLLVHIF